MKKTLSFILLFFTSILIVNAEYYENHTMKISHDNWMNYAFSDTYKVDESYIYTEFSDSDDGNVNEHLNIIKSDVYGKKEWTKKFENVPHTYHNILVEGENILFISDTIGLKVLSIEDGSIKYEDTTLLGEDIKKISDNYIILASNKITIVDKNYKVKYELEVTDLTSLGSASLFVEYEVADSNVYILAYNVDADSNKKTVLITANSELKNSKVIDLTYDENQGFLSENNYFQDVKEFTMINGNLYQVGFDIYKIALTGETELLLDSDSSGRDCFDIVEYNNSIFTAEVEWTDYNGYAKIIERDYDFKELKSYYPKNNNNKNSWATAKNITISGNDLVVKWMEDNNYNFYITEYSTEEKKYLNPSGTSSCKIISGTGYNLGDEIKCGTEEFYVVKSTDEEITMLAKYNLYVGKEYYILEFEETYEEYSDATNYVYSMYDGYASIYTNADGLYDSAMVYNYLNYNFAKQDKTAIGAHGDESGNPEFPEIGVVDLRDGGFTNGYGEGYGNNHYYDFVVNLDSQLGEPLLEYSYYLNYIDVEVESVSILSVSDINSIVKQVTGEELPLAEWYDSADVTNEHYGPYKIGSLKEKLPEEYSWLWETTYWTRTASGIYESGDLTYFVDTLGDLCGAGSCDEAVGAGIRPLVTIPISELKYQVITKTDGNGTVKANTILAPSGELIEFTVTPKEGYKLEKITVKDSDGRVVTFTDYKFTMPDADVLIEVTFVTDNPVTADFAIYIAISLAIAVVFVIIHNKKKLEWINQ